MVRHSVCFGAFRLDDRRARALLIGFSFRRPASASARPLHSAVTPKVALLLDLDLVDPSSHFSVSLRSSTGAWTPAERGRSRADDRTAATAQDVEHGGKRLSQQSRRR